MKTRHFRDIKKVVLLLIIAFLGYNIYYSDYIQTKYFYPFPYKEEVRQNSRQYQLNPNLLLAIIKNESKFNPSAISANGAMGLMQIMPETGRWISAQTKGAVFNDKMLLDPNTNIKFGSWYLSELNAEFFQNEILVLAAYNAGRGNVQSWIKKYGWNKNFSNINEIPFVETQVYIRRILHDKQMYAKYYPPIQMR